MLDNTTIFAPATAPGRAGIAVIRISGPRAKDALAMLGVAPLPPPRAATLFTLLHPREKRPVDRAVVLWFPGPHSFTGDDVAELHVHGSRAVIRTLCDALGAMEHLRMAEPGEFARRAFFRGKMDLAEAEGLADLVDAETEAQRAQAIRVLRGEASARYERLRQQVLHALAHMEAVIDFPDEDLPAEVEQGISGEVRALADAIVKLLDDNRMGERIRDGISIVILGAPNVGKSSLLNALARRDAAIVSHTAGTTRDLIEVHMDIAGYACVLVDTAGLRDSADLIEQEGIRRARERAKASDIRVLLFDGTQLPALDEATVALAEANALVAVSKADALAAPLPGLVAGLRSLSVSVRGEPGIAPLLSALEARLRGMFDTGTEAPLITRARHREALTKAESHLQHFLSGGAIEIRCEELRQAALQLGKITGKIAVDELLDQIFREFCIGK